MSTTDLLRASRDGDQFHYYWAARQCLALLAPGASLVAVSIEGASAREFRAATANPFCGWWIRRGSLVDGA